MKAYLHSTESFDDEKIFELYTTFGYEGLGLYYTCLEKLGKQEKPVKTIVLKRQLNVGKKLEKCWEFMESLGLLSSNNGETFSKVLANYIKTYDKKKENNNKRLSEWRENQQVIKNETHYERNGNASNLNLNINLKETKTETIVSGLNLNGASAPGVEKVEPLKSVSEKEKKAAGQKKTDTVPHWKTVTKVWFDFYTEQKKEHPTFAKQETGSLKFICLQLQKRAEKKALVWDEKTAENTLLKFLQMAYGLDWLQQNFMLHNLERQFDKIITTLQNGEKSTKKHGQGVDDFARKVAGAMVSNTGAGTTISDGSSW